MGRAGARKRLVDVADDEEDRAEDGDQVGHQLVSEHPHADVFLPAWAEDGDRLPVIVSVGPYFATNTLGQSGPPLRFEDMMEEGRPFERGFAYVQVDSRGYGGSAGCYDMGGRGERMDVKAAVEWAAAQPWSTGRVGMWVVPGTICVLR